MTTERAGDLHRLHDEVGALLSHHEHRYTSGRRRLIEIIAVADRPLTLPEILEADDELSQSSAYRNLDVLESSRAVRRVISAGDHTHFELAESLVGHHHHLICLDCGVIEDIVLDEQVESVVDGALHDLADRAGFTPLHHAVDLHGYCARCS